MMRYWWVPHLGLMAIAAVMLYEQQTGNVVGEGAPGFIISQVLGWVLFLVSATVTASLFAAILIGEWRRGERKRRLEECTLRRCIENG